MQTKHVVMFSTGAGSAWLAKYVVDKYGKDDTIILITDTKWEDDDNYRFMRDVANYIGIEITEHSDGRTPEDIFRKDLYFGNFGTAPCSKILKMEQTFLFVQECIENGIMPILYFGIDYKEARRAPRLAYNYKHNVDVFEDGVELRFPLIAEIDGEPVSGKQLIHTRDFLNSEKMPKIYNKEIYQSLEEQGAVICTANPKQEIENEWGIKLPRMYTAVEEEVKNNPNNTKAKELLDKGIKGYSHANCFSGNTRFITDKGVKTFKETTGSKVRVLGIRADWKDAEVKYFGQQEIVELTLTRNGKIKVIETTNEHRWFKRKNRKEHTEVFTQDLKEGDYLKSMYSKFNTLIRPSKFGIAHGITFGDVSVTHEYNPPARLLLCGEKSDELLQYFKDSPQKEVEGTGVEVKDLPRYFKQYPSLDECKSYLYGWLVGYFATDGCACNSEFKLSSAKKENLEFFRNVANILGIATNPITMHMRKGYGENETPLYSVTFINSTLNKSMFIRKKHVEEFVQWEIKLKQRPSEWKVVSVKPTGRIEDVYCAVVPEGNAFTLEDNIYTGNCGGICVKGGMGHYSILYATWKDRYLYMENLEREINEAQIAKNGRRYTILSKLEPTGELDDKGKPIKKKVPYSLEEYRIEVLEGDINKQIEIEENTVSCECVF